VISVIKEVYQRYGFEPLETPAVENIETLTGKYGEEGNQLIFKILKRGVHEGTGEADLALRYDLTVPFSRFVSEYAVMRQSFSSVIKSNRGGALIDPRAGAYGSFTSVILMYWVPDQWWSRRRSVRPP